MDTFFTELANFYRSYSVLIDIVLIVVVALLLRWTLLATVKRVVNRIVNGVKARQRVDDTQALEASPLVAVRVVQRTRTIGSVLSNIITWGVVAFAIAFVLSTLGFSIAALVASAGVIGAALGFGAQNIIKDMLNGLFMVMEDQLGVGDVVDLGPATGVVEYVGVRITAVRDVNGTLWYVRNGEITRVGNMSQGWARVIIDLAVPYDADIDLVQEQMLVTATELANNPKWRTRILEQPEIWGLESISAEALVIRLVLKTRTNAKDDVARELRMRLKHALDDMHVKLPALNSIVLSGFDGAASVKGSNPPKTRPVPTTRRPAPRGSTGGAP